MKQLAAFAIVALMASTAFGDYLFFEEFESGIPGTWTLVDNLGNSPFQWTTTAVTGRTNYTPSASGYCADADADYYNYGGPPYDISLLSPTFPVVGNTTAEWEAAYNDLGTADFAEAIIHLSASGDILVYHWDEDHYLPGESFLIDLSAYAGETGQLEFRYAGPGWDWYYEIDRAGVIPEPASLMLLGLGLVLLRRR